MTLSLSQRILRAVWTFGPFVMLSPLFLAATCLASGRT